MIIKTENTIALCNAAFCNCILLLHFARNLLLGGNPNRKFPPTDQAAFMEFQTFGLKPQAFSQL